LLENISHLNNSLLNNSLFTQIRLMSLHSVLFRLCLHFKSYKNLELVRKENVLIFTKLLSLDLKWMQNWKTHKIVSKNNWWLSDYKTANKLLIFCQMISNWKNCSYYQRIELNINYWGKNSTQNLRFISDFIKCLKSPQKK